MTIPGWTSGFEEIVANNSLKGVIDRMPESCTKRVMKATSHFLEKKLGRTCGGCCMNVLAIFLFFIFIPLMIPLLLAAVCFGLLTKVFGRCGIKQSKPNDRVPQES